ncbi:hypothetical protein B7494_g39 [Chlorociboria aeruginascens]|nr:hypothetical protein B7494_g39 [Chlorociboria aeruginascens]
MPATVIFSSHEMSFIFSILIALGFYVISIIIYRLGFHPLARYPGPLLGRLTDWYSIYHAWKGDRPLDFYRLHQKYGQFVRFGPNRISVNSVEGLKAVYGAKANTQKSTYYSVFDHFFEYPSIETVIDKEHHMRKRRVLSRALSDRALKSMESVLSDKLRGFCDQFSVKPGYADEKAAEAWSDTKNMSELLKYLTFDLMGDFCFGQSFNVMEKSENRYLLKVICDGIHALSIVGHIPGLLRFGIGNLFFPKLVRGLYEYKEYSQKLANDCLKGNSEKEVDSVFRLLLQETEAENGGEAFLPELVSESSLLLIAGSSHAQYPSSKSYINDKIGFDTTSTACANTLFHLLNNPQALNRLSTEIRQTFSTASEIKDAKALSGCHYLRACIDESMRISPPVGAMLPREVLPGGLFIDDYFFPAGTDIGIAAYNIHHNETYFKDPFTYNPSRWIPGDGMANEELLLARSAFAPFSTGPRGCAGKNMAYLEVGTVVTMLMWAFDMRLVGNEGMDADEARKRWDEQTLDKFVAQVNGPLVEFKRREF